MSTMAISNSKAAGRKSLKERFEAYIEENGDYFAAAMAAMSGNYYAAAELVNEARQ